MQTIFTPINCRADYPGLDESYMDEMMDRVGHEHLPFEFGALMVCSYAAKAV